MIARACHCCRCCCARVATWQCRALARVQWATRPGPRRCRRDRRRCRRHDRAGHQRPDRGPRCAARRGCAGRGRGRPAAEERAGRAGAGPRDDVGDLHGVPDPPLGFVRATSWMSARALLGEGEGPSRSPACADWGCLGRADRQDGPGGRARTRRSCDAISPTVCFGLWLGESPDLVGAQIDLLRRLGVTAREVRTTLDGVRAPRTASPNGAACWWSTTSGARRPRRLSMRPALVGRVLYTTRDPNALRDVRARSAVSTSCRRGRHVSCWPHRGDDGGQAARRRRAGRRGHAGRSARDRAGRGGGRPWWARLGGGCRRAQRAAGTSSSIRMRTCSRRWGSRSRHSTPRSPRRMRRWPCMARTRGFQSRPWGGCGAICMG